MKSLGLVSCTKRKQNYPCKTSEMYSVSDLFRKAYAYSIKNYDLVAILSAKYYLLLPDDVIEPYCRTLNDMSSDEVREWSNRVLDQMKNRLNLSDFNVVLFHAGKRYRQFLIPKLEKIGLRCEVPLGNLGIGKQLA